MSRILYPLLMGLGAVAVSAYAFSAGRRARDSGLAGASLSDLDLRDSEHVSTLLPEVQPAFVELMLRAYELDPDARIESSRRSVAQQNALYAQGRTVPGSIITHARGCQSFHVLLRAIDIWGLTDAQYRELAEFWRGIGGKWGGDFSSFYDPVHFQYHPGLTMEQLCPDPDVSSYP